MCDALIIFVNVRKDVFVLLQSYKLTWKILVSEMITENISKLLNFYA